jgi:AcrR family transcriptional regulator
MESATELDGDIMAEARKPRERDPVATRAAILAAARTLLGKDGPEGLSVLQVAKLAGVNRGTAYQHFPDRDGLLKATIESVSEALVEAVWPAEEAPARWPGMPFSDRTVLSSAGRLAEFTASNASFCRVWLFELLSSDDPGSDPFSRAWIDSVKAFCASDKAVPGIDAEAFAVFTLTAYLSWPVWRHAHKLSEGEQKMTAKRLVDEVMRLSLYGVMKPDQFPTVREELEHETPKPARRRKAARAE